MFVVSKLLSAITQPLFWLALWWLLALLLLGRKPRAAKRMLWTGLLGLGLLGLQAPPDALLRALESRYPAQPTSALLQQHAGLLVLGGALEHPASWQAHGQVPLGQSAERMTVPVGLMRQHPQWQLIFSGGEGRLLTTGVTEGQLAQQFYAEQGVDMARVQIEQGARTTRENAQRVAQTLGERCGQQSWLLVTSAWHMPRSMAEFEAVGCQVTAYPVDFRTGAHTDWYSYHMADSLLRWQMALHEWLGRLVYAVTR
ncbi:YdcF family protein [Comamonas sp.]|uniref:YdcF family protein n=1 Tax=Comamonas sp. TaxID=34028 RepID=UPI00289F8B9E|nr:YdcF family protein [Comamonas sp.]